MSSETETVCRLCLVTDAPVRSIANTPLQEVYEKLTNVTLNKMHKPVVACSVCYWQLKKCHNLMTRSLRADELLTQILQTGASINRELIALVDRKTFKLNNGLSISPMELATFIKPEPVIKEEIKSEPFSYPHEKGPDGEKEPFIINVKLENLEDEDNVEEAERQEHENDIMNEGLTIQENFLKKEVVEDTDIKNYVINDRLTDKYDTMHTEKDVDKKIDIMNHVINDRLTDGSDTIYKEVAAKDVDNEIDIINVIINERLTDEYDTMHAEVVIDDTNNDKNIMNHDINDRLTDGNDTMRKAKVAAEDVDDEIDIINNLNERYDTIHAEEVVVTEDTDNEIDIMNHVANERLIDEYDTVHAEVIIEDTNNEMNIMNHVKNDRLTDEYDTMHVEEVSVEHIDHEIEIMNDVINDKLTCVAIYVEGEGLDDTDCHIEQMTTKNLKVTSEPAKGPVPAKKYKSAQDTVLKQYKYVTEKEMPNDANIEHVSESTSGSPTAKLNRGTYYTLAPKSGVSGDTFEKDTLIKHVEHANETNSREENIVRTMYECSMCPCEFDNKHSFYRHLRTHKIPYKCRICQREFKLRSSLNNHFKIHTGNKAYKCYICQHLFIEKANYGRHLKTHSGEKPYKCDICQHGFITKLNLNSHLVTHTGEKPFKCEICEQRFGHDRSLRKHLILHTSEKPFKCGDCECCFYRKEHLKNHIKTHDTQRKRSSK